MINRLVSHIQLDVETAPSVLHLLNGYQFNPADRQDLENLRGRFECWGGSVSDQTTENHRANLVRRLNNLLVQRPEGGAPAELGQRAREAPGRATPASRQAPPSERGFEALDQGLRDDIERLIWDCLMVGIRREDISAMALLENDAIDEADRALAEAYAAHRLAHGAPNVLTEEGRAWLRERVREGFTNLDIMLICFGSREEINRLASSPDDDRYEELRQMPGLLRAARA